MFLCELVTFFMTLTSNDVCYNVCMPHAQGEPGDTGDTGQIGPAGVKVCMSV